MPPNRYGTQAMTHWRKWLPNLYSELTNPEQYFTDLGLRVETEIADLAAELAGDDPPTPESYLDKVGRLNAARMRAEEIVLREEVLLEPEPGAGQDPNADQPTASLDLSDSDGWTPLIEDATSPYWKQIRQRDPADLASLGRDDETPGR
jgi:hypothetical protein